MRNINFHHNALTAAEITTRRLCKLHRVTLFSPAICRVNRGSKVIVQGASEMLATPQQLIILPAEVELEVINQPENGLFCSDLLSLTPELLADFKHRYMSEPQTGRLTSLCAPLAPEMSFMWQSVLRAVREGLSGELQHHQAMGLLLALYQAGYAGPLLDAAPSFAAGVPELPPDRGRGPYGLRAGAITVDVATHWRHCAKQRLPVRLAL